MHGYTAEEKIRISSKPEEPEYSEYSDYTYKFNKTDIKCHTKQRENNEWNGWQDSNKVNNAVNIFQLPE